MRKKKLPPTLENILRLMEKKLREYKGESRRSYHKAFSSFQFFVLNHHNLSSFLTGEVLENWIVENIVSGLTKSTISFYLDKISSLYSGIACDIQGGKEPLFKIIKKNFRSLNYDLKASTHIKKTTSKLKNIWRSDPRKAKNLCIIDRFFRYPENRSHHGAMDYIWASIALKAHVKASVVKGIIENVPQGLEFLDLCDSQKVGDKELKTISEKVQNYLMEEEPEWFALRLRPHTRYSQLIERCGRLPHEIEIPEFFYPCKEITRKVGKKVIWEGRPIIHDVVFFYYRRSRIYPLITHIYDVAWCYRRNGWGAECYEAIPEKALEDFKKAIDFLTPDYDVAPAGEMKLNPGDRVIILNGSHAGNIGEIIKKPEYDKEGNIIYRVTLLHGFGHWDIGIDARMLKRDVPNPEKV